jgi:hypothetical protein
MLKNFFFFVTDEKANNARSLVLGKAFQPILILRVRQEGGGKRLDLALALLVNIILSGKAFQGWFCALFFLFVIHEESE